MNYILVNSNNGYLSRNYIGTYKARDYIKPLQYVYGGRVVADDAIIFDSIQDAIRYQNSNKWLQNVSNYWMIKQYNVCCNCLIKSNKITWKVFDDNMRLIAYVVASDDYNALQFIRTYLDAKADATQAVAKDETIKPNVPHITI